MFIPTQFPMKIEIDHELVLFAILGILGGMLSSVFVSIMTKIIYARHRIIYIIEIIR